MCKNSAALIVGFTIQGLAVARALTSAGIPVYAVEKGMQRSRILISHPLTYTTHAKILHRDRLLGGELVATLLNCRSTIPEQNVVLFPASDNTVRVLADSWDQLQHTYFLSWAENREEVARIIQKGMLPSYCDSAGVLYPKTILVNTELDYDRAVGALEFPMLVKPNKPASSFKTRICRNEKDLLGFLDSEKSNWPLVVQEWIDGPDDSIYAYTCLMHRRSEIFGMTSRKIRSSPPGLGRATVTETIEDGDVQELAQKLLVKLDVSGPVAMEFKKDPDGRFWFIEANVGRTEYCVDLAIQAGFNIPLLEFYQALDKPLPPVTTELIPSVWYDTDKEPFCYLALCFREMTWRPFDKMPIFPYWRRENLAVLLAAVVRIVREFGHRAVSKFQRIF